MGNARLMDRPEDYWRFDVSQEGIESWEDGRRITHERGWWEWWYFDAILDDGTRVVVQFFTKSGANMLSGRDHPKIVVRITMPDGSDRAGEATFPAAKASWTYDGCNVDYDGNLFSGDFHDYTIRAKVSDGLAVDLGLHSLSKPYRPGSAYISFETPYRLFTWLCAVPKGEVSGTLTIDGQEIQAHGFGYHDHQWGNVNFLGELNHWVWARQSFPDLSLILFDLTTNGKTDYTRFPIILIEDAEGGIVFESTSGVSCDVLGEYHDDISGKDYPTGFRYGFEADGKKAIYTMRMDQVIECNGMGNMSAPRRTAARLAGIDPAYTRYSAIGELVLTDGNGQRIERSGDLIYEFMYPGSDYRGHMQGRYPA